MDDAEVPARQMQVTTETPAQKGKMTASVEKTIDAVSAKETEKKNRPRIVDSDDSDGQHETAEHTKQQAPSASSTRKRVLDSDDQNASDQDEERSEQAAKRMEDQSILDLLVSLDNAQATRAAGESETPNFFQYRSLYKCRNCDSSAAGGMATCQICCETQILWEVQRPLELPDREVALGSFWQRRMRNMVMQPGYLPHAISIFVPINSTILPVCGVDGLPTHALVVGIRHGELSSQLAGSKVTGTEWAEPDAAALRMGVQPVFGAEASRKVPYVIIGRQLNISIGRLPTGRGGRLSIDRRRAAALGDGAEKEKVDGAEKEKAPRQQCAERLSSSTPLNKGTRVLARVKCTAQMLRAALPGDVADKTALVNALTAGTEIVVVGEVMEDSGCGNAMVSLQWVTALGAVVDEEGAPVVVQKKKAHLFAVPALRQIKGVTMLATNAVPRKARHLDPKQYEDELPAVYTRLPGDDKVDGPQLIVSGPKMRTEYLCALPTTEMKSTQQLPRVFETLENLSEEAAAFFLQGVLFVVGKGGCHTAAAAAPFVGEGVHHEIWKRERGTSEWHKLVEAELNRRSVDRRNTFAAYLYFKRHIVMNKVYEEVVLVVEVNGQVHTFCLKETIVGVVSEAVERDSVGRIVVRDGVGRMRPLRRLMTCQGSWAGWQATVADTACG